MNVGIVHQSADAARTLERSVLLAPDHRVLWTASTGEDAVALCAGATPDVVLLDLRMPDADVAGISRRIIAATPCAILIVASSVHAQAAHVFEAMGGGALDAVDMPSLDAADLPGGAAPLLSKLSTIGRLIGASDGHRAAGSPLEAAGPRGCRQLVVVGASAGGPAALATLLEGLPDSFSAAIVIVQHVDAQFASGMSEWLNRHSALAVSVAAEGDVPERGRVLIAGTNHHLVFKTSTRLGYTAEPSQGAYRPSIDVFFNSAAQFWRGDLAGVILTGMGRDGALGLKTLRAHGCHTIAQDEASSAVYGMPKAAAAMGAAVEVLPVDRIARRLTELLPRSVARATV